MRILYLGMGGNRYLAEEIYKKLLTLDLGHTYEIISEWEPNEELAKKGIIYTKWDINTWTKPYTMADVILCPQNPVQPGKSHVKIITAMALKKAVICSAHPAYAEIIDDGRNGFMFTDAMQIPAILESLKDVTYRSNIAINGYNTVVGRFSKEQTMYNFSKIVTDRLKIPNAPKWAPSTLWSATSDPARQLTAGIKVAVVYAPLPTPYHSYGDFIFDAMKFLFKDCVHVSNIEELGVIVNEVGLVVLVEFNPDWYKVVRMGIKDKCVLVGWDTHGHYMFSYLYNLCRHMKASFITGRHDVQRMNAMGLQNVHWIPEGHSEKIHTFENESVEERKGISFIGQVDNVIRDAGGLTREDYVKILKLHYGDDFAVYTGMYGDLYRKCISKHRLTLDLPIAHNIGTRIFEASAMGVPTIRTRNDSPGLDEFFVDRINMIEFTPGNISEMLDKIDTALALSPMAYRSICEQIAEYSARQSYVNRLSWAMETLGYV